MFQTFKGTIVDSTKISSFTKKNGEKSDQAMLYVQQMTNNQYPLEVAVKVTGNNALFANMVGANVELEYVKRVFAFMKNGEKCFGNDIYAHRIKLIDAEQEEPSVKALPAPPQPKGLLPAPPQPKGLLPAPVQPAGLLPAPPQPKGLLPATTENSNNEVLPF